jgi:hypothetical protein
MDSAPVAVPPMGNLPDFNGWMRLTNGQLLPIAWRPLRIGGLLCAAPLLRRIGFGIPMRVVSPTVSQKQARWLNQVEIENWHADHCAEVPGGGIKK